MTRVVKTLVEAALRFVASALLVISASMFCNLLIYKSRSLLVLLLLAIVVVSAITLVLKRRSLATSEEEIESMFPLSKKLAKGGNVWPALWFAFMDMAAAWNIYCSLALTEAYKGIDTQMAELYEVSANAVAVMRCIPGTFAARAFYVVVTEMQNFDFEFYDQLLLYDYMLLALVAITALLWTIMANVKRYNLSVRNIKNANY